MSITENIKKLKEQLPEDVTLVAVSKFHPKEAVEEAYAAGQRIFGESRAQELTAKQKNLPTDIQWHFIGPLQSNKVKDIAPFIHTIHSIDSLKLLSEVNRQAAKNNRIINVLLEIHVAQEEAKHGFTPEESKKLLKEVDLKNFPNINICGIMGMATFTNDVELIEKEFATLDHLFKELKNEYFKNDDSFKILSMGMSHDYSIAIKAGSNMVRIGTSIFGEREY